MKDCGRPQQMQKEILVFLEQKSLEHNIEVLQMH